ncbi:MAG: DnaT-like ssDNA-binding protein [Ramlibacter sp.]
MALIVETGAGLADAESYATVEQADAYLAARNYPAWALLAPEAKEAALRMATAYMHAFAWKGIRSYQTQALDWPRTGVVADGYPVDGDRVPAAVRNACIELARRASTGELAPDQGQQIASKSVGPVSVTYQAGSTNARRFPHVAVMLSSLMHGGGGSFAILRA